MDLSHSAVEPFHTSLRSECRVLGLGACPISLSNKTNKTNQQPTRRMQVAEFLAEDSLVEIICNRNLPEIRLIKGSFGPLRPLAKTQVPLWVALQLAKKDMCRIVVPLWMEPGLYRTVISTY